MSTYRLLDHIGRGGMGDVFEAERILQKGTPTRVACKSMREELHADPKYLDMFFREARISLNICHNDPGLVTVYECIEDTEGRSHLIMELVEGSSLHSIYNANGLSSWASWDVLRLVAHDVLATLAYVHEKGVVHRDVSPCNILVSCEGDIKLSDLGLAKLAGTGHSDPDRFHGKWPFASPEAIRRESVDARSDLFSFAAVLYQLITTRCVYGDAEEYAHVETSLDRWRPPTLAEDVPLDLRTLITGLLQVDPDARRPARAKQALPLLWPFDADAARIRLADMARSLYERRQEQRRRRTQDRASFTSQEIIIQSRVHIDPHADTDEDTRLFEPGERKSTVSLAPPIDGYLSLPPSPAPRKRRRVLMSALVLCLLGWLAYDRYDNATPPQPETTAGAPDAEITESATASASAEQADAQAIESATTSAENEPASPHPSAAELQTASTDAQALTSTTPSRDSPATSPAPKHKPRAHRKRSKRRTRKASPKPVPEREKPSQFMPIPEMKHP